MAGKILVVGDNPDTLESIVSWLRQEGNDVILAAQSDIRHVEQVQPDLLLLTITATDGAGLAMCRQLRRNRGTAHIPVVLVMPENGTQDRVNGVMAGANDCITLPYQITD